MPMMMTEDVHVVMMVAVVHERSRERATGEERKRQGAGQDHFH